MSKASMSIKTFKNVASVLPTWTSVLLRADHGVGKSKIVRQVAANIRKSMQLADASRASKKDFFPVIDRRLSQMTEGDMVGLPSTDGETTRFNPPDWFKRACDEPCALFLDELNRATPEVMQAAFQVVLDRELNGWKLHPETRVYSAINTNSVYTVNEMDPALLDRFFVVDLEPTVEEWCEWARSDDPVHGGNLHPNWPDFISTQVPSTAAGKSANGQSSWLYPPKNYEPGSVTPSPRSWVMSHEALKEAGLCDNPDDPTFYHVLVGFLGVEPAIAFRDFCKNVDSRIDGDEIVNKYHEPKVRAKVERLGQSKKNAVVDKVADYVLNNVKKLSEKQGKNVSAIMADLPDELKVVLWGKLVSKGVDNIELTKSVHAHCCKQVLDIFGVPMGQAGIGVIPNIPGIFKNQAPTKK